MLSMLGLKGTISLPGYRVQAGETEISTTMITRGLGGRLCSTARLEEPKENPKPETK